MRGIQEWLSFYSSRSQPHPVSTRARRIHSMMKLKNTLRYLQGEDLITHLGLEYYD